MTTTEGYPLRHPGPAPSGTSSGLGTGPQTEPVVLLHGGNVAAWMWEPQVERLGDLDLLTPDLPGFGTRSAEPWVSLDEAADDVARLVREAAPGRRVHVVGLSLGAMVASRLVVRHPDAVASLLLSGAMLDGVHGITRALGVAQMRLWDRAWYWRALARPFGMPPDVQDLFVRTGLGIGREKGVRMMREVYDDGWPAGLESVRVPVLAVAGEREPRPAHAGLRVLAERLPAAHRRVAPRVHHQWSVEDPDLFSDMVRAWVRDGVVHPGLIPSPPGRSSG